MKKVELLIHFLEDETFLSLNSWWRKYSVFTLFQIIIIFSFFRQFSLTKTCRYCSFISDVKLRIQAPLEIHGRYVLPNYRELWGSTVWPKKSSYFNFEPNFIKKSRISEGKYLEFWILICSFQSRISKFADKSPRITRATCILKYIFNFFTAEITKPSSATPSQGKPFPKARVHEAGETHRTALVVSWLYQKVNIDNKHYIKLQRAITLKNMSDDIFIKFGQLTNWKFWLE